MWLDMESSKDHDMGSPTLVVAVSTSMPQYRALYSQAREMGEYMLKKMKFEKIATVYSSAFPPEVIVREDGISSLPACYFYQAEGKDGLVLFAGDASPMDGQYEFAHLVLDFARGLGVKELYSVGARWAENPLSPEVDPEPSGFATDKIGVAKLKKHGVKVLSEEPAPFFASLVVAMAQEYGIRGYKLSVDHGEPSPHVRSVTKLLGVLSEMTGFETPLDELKAQTKPSSQPKVGGDSTIYK
jgi:uncharacterized protein